MAWNARPAHRRGRIGSSSVAPSGRLIIDVSVNPIGLPDKLYENWFEDRRWLRHVRRKEPDKGSLSSRRRVWFRVRVRRRTVTVRRDRLPERGGVRASGS